MVQDAAREPAPEREDGGADGAHSSDDRSEVSAVLKRIDAGDSTAVSELFPLVYGELRQLARRHLAPERPDHTLGATALVHEAYLRLVRNPDELRWESRRHFFGAAARAMRQILIDGARRYQTKKRGGARVVVNLDELSGVVAPGPDSILALESALLRLEEVDPRAGELVALRYFAGVSVEDTARALGVSTATVKRRWQFAKAWLYRELEV